MNVIQKCLVIICLSSFHQDGFVAVSKEVAPLPVPDVEPPCHRDLQPFHAHHKIRFRGFQKQMVVVAHEHPRMNPPPRLPARLSEHLQKKPAVIVIKEDRFSAISSRHHVVISPSILDSNVSCHGCSL